MTTISNLYAPAGLPQSYKILEVVPRNRAENALNEKTLKPMLVDTHSLHMFRQMESKIAWLQIVGVFAIFFLGTVVVEFFGSRYFSFGQPVYVKDVLLDRPWAYQLNVLFIVWDRVFAFITSYYIGRWRNGVLFNNQIEIEDQVSYSKAMFVLLTDHIMTWLRYPVMVVFVYSQIDFALAYAIPDILIGMLAAHMSVTTMINTCETEAIAKKQRSLPAKSAKEALADLNQQWYQTVCGVRLDMVLLITLCEYLQLVAYIMVFYGTGVLQSNYFQFHPPFAVFGRVFKQKEKYAFIIIFVFIDQILASLLNFIVGPYVNTNIMNASAKFTDIRYGVKGARFIYLSRKIFQWIRTMFVLNFTLSQFIFFFFIIIADTIITIWLTDRALANRQNSYELAHPEVPKQKKTTNRVLQYARELQISPMQIVLVVWLEMIIVILVMIFQFDIQDRLTYFNMPPPLTIFDVVMTSLSPISFVFLYAFVDRIIFTLTTEITFPYISNVISACDPSEDYRYDYYELMFIMTANDITNWIRRIVGFNFLLSNVSLVIIEGGTDIILSWIILERYLRFKNNENAYTYLNWWMSFHGNKKLPNPDSRYDYVELTEGVPTHIDRPVQSSAPTTTATVSVERMRNNAVSSRYHSSAREEDAIKYLEYICKTPHGDEI